MLLEKWSGPVGLHSPVCKLKVTKESDAELTIVLLTGVSRTVALTDECRRAAAKASSQTGRMGIKLVIFQSGICGNR